jgi:hypothetical protein
MDPAVLSWFAQLIGLAGGAFAGGMVGGKKAMKELREIVEGLRVDVDSILTRLGLPVVARPKNGKTADLVDTAVPADNVKSIQRGG